ncbi:hypothetical protein [Azospirillum thermophilum]|uniref:Uncharacterized protein n=1 Tax=Azospirillum thermophilum TaxID=2202148 RepID=A0A2S2D0R1_9PROT|nr:hypothetical protein [Azospirillum thermophilum]AWK90353.1 hypothetical protein DEW08_30535 [Azospirillum thermophilum]
MTAVRFTKPAPPYLTGDVAKFDPARARSLIDRQVAEALEAEDPTAEPPAGEEAAKPDPKGKGKAQSEPAA